MVKNGDDDDDEDTPTMLSQTRTTPFILKTMS